jgi:hypothetical protein
MSHIPFGRIAPEIAMGSHYFLASLWLRKSPKDVQTVPLSDIKQTCDLRGPQIQNPRAIAPKRPGKSHHVCRLVRFRRTNRPLLHHDLCHRRYKIDSIHDICPEGTTMQSIPNVQMRWLNVPMVVTNFPPDAQRADIRWMMPKPIRHVRKSFPIEFVIRFEIRLHAIHSQWNRPYS